jgi:predicted phosphodiesterase
MGLIDKFSELGNRGSDIRAAKTPEEWRPRMDIGETGGYVIALPRPAGQVPDQRDLLQEFDMNPDDWVITSVRRGKWQSALGEWLETVRINVVPASLASEDRADVAALINEIRSWKPSKKLSKVNGDLAFVFAPSDQQIGKKANGEGTPETVERLMNSLDLAVARLNELIKSGRPIGTVVIALLGDHVEGIVSQGGALQSHAASDMGLTEQTRVARRILMMQVKAFAPLVDKVIVAVVNGNHDEVSRQVKLDPSEGWNTEIASAVQDACAENPELAHVEFRYPSKDHQTLAIDVNGVMLGLFHGHQTGRDVKKYIQEQAAGRTALGGCDVFLSGHYHNFAAMDIGERLWLQCPTVDPGSAWFRDRHGLESNPGILTMVIGAGYNPRQDISIIPAVRSL